jgi:hypothetical protein
MARDDLDDERQLHNYPDMVFCSFIQVAMIASYMLLLQSWLIVLFNRCCGSVNLYRQAWKKIRHTPTFTISRSSF